MKYEINFLIDQRTTRKMVIGGVDNIASKKAMKKQGRKEKCLLEKQQVDDLQQPCCSRSLLDNLSIDSSDSCNSSSVSSYNAYSSTKQPPQIVQSSIKKMRLTLPCLALACDRTGVSDRSAAIIASSVLKDVGIISSNDQSRVIDRSQVRRARSKKRAALQNINRKEIIRGLYFDGRRDNTLVLIEKNGKYYRNRQMEAVVNTGLKGGVIRLIEAELNKPLHWFVCQLHSNELPLRHLLVVLDGKTSGPQCFSGPIGFQLQKCEAMPIVKFSVIPTTLPDITNIDLSSDQKYLFMLADERQEIRNLAYTRILKARLENNYGLRKFEVPSLNFDAEDYTDLINWQDHQITEPPLTLNISNEFLENIVENGLGTHHNIKDFPCHTQAVERCIKLVTDASSSVCGESKRDGFIRARLLSRQKMPSFNTKKQFNV